MIIKYYSNQAEAYIDKGLLVDNGIPAEVMVDALANIYPTPFGSIGSITVVVPENFASEAIELLNHKGIDEN